MSRLVLDIGNTRTSVGLFISGRITFHWRITTEHWTADDLWVILRSLLRGEGEALPESVAFACVVPQVRHSVRNLCSRHLDLEPVEVSAQTAGIGISYRYPHELGADRLANAVGAAALGELPAIVADFGTATTFDVIDSDGGYLGGAISPGIGTAAGELFRKAEKINPVDLEFPESPLGRDTREAVRSGVLLGAVGATDYLIEGLSAVLEEAPVLWATGGWARGIVGECSNEFRICPELTLVGIDRIGEMADCEGKT